MTPNPQLLWPLPKKISLLDEYLILPPLLVLPEMLALNTDLQRLARALACKGIASQTGIDKCDLRLNLIPGGISESYKLWVTGGGIELSAPDLPGLACGLRTLAQWISLKFHHSPAGNRQVQGIVVEDEPDFSVRGAMLDISRTKVPRLDTLHNLIDTLASWKINQIQLYMEHTFAYSGHQVVWQDADPLTPEMVKELDSFCRDRFIELVPNQNSFGHFHRWLVHQPYRPLAECPEGIVHPFSPTPEPFSLCPSDPGTIFLLEELYGQLLPCFSGNLFNVGLDETFDIGLGRSSQLCEEKGKGRVYLDFLKKVHQLVKQKGKRMQFWGDIILNHPELVAELPKDAIALEWGYEANHPFEQHGKIIRNSGLEFYVCPGTSSWQSIVGRTRNAIENLTRAAVEGFAAGASGYLITDWGDFGHLQPLPFSYPGLLAGSGFSWNVATANALFDPAPFLDQYLFQDRSFNMGKFLCALGDVYLEADAPTGNATVLFLLLRLAGEGLDHPRLAGLNQAGLERVLVRLDELEPLLKTVKIQAVDADEIVAESSWAIDMLRFTCALGSARLQQNCSTKELDPASREELDRWLAGLIVWHRSNWLRRNRPGGLDESCEFLERVRRLLKTGNE